MSSTPFITDDLTSVSPRQTLGLLNCTPPWMTEDESLWCCDNIVHSEGLQNQMEHLFDRILDGKADVGPCLTPCRTTWYKSQSGKENPLFITEGRDLGIDNPKKS